MRKLAWCSGAFSAAILLSQYLLPAGARPWCALFAAAAGLAAALLPNRMVRLPVLLLAGGVCAGLLWSMAADARLLTPARKLDGQTGEITFVASDYGWQTAYGSAAVGHIRQDGETVRTQLWLDRTEPVEPGDTLVLTARLRLTADGSDDYGYLAAKGIFLLADQQGEDVVFSPGDAAQLRYLPQRMARALKASIERVFPEDVSPVVKAVVTGDKGELDPVLYARLQNAGLAHTVAVSGMHMGFLVAMIQLLSRRRRRVAVIGIPVILCFMAVTGFSPSVTRAGVMSILSLLGPALNRESDVPTSLAFSLMLLLAWNPYSARSISLQLSYGSVAGILLFTEPLQRFFFRRCLPRAALPRRLLRFVWSSVAVTLGAMSLTTPLTAHYFGVILLLSPLANLLCLWALSVIFGLGMILGVLGLVLPGPAAAAAWVPWVFARYFMAVGSWIGGLPFAALTLSNDYLRVWLFFAYGVVLLLFFVRKWRGFLFLPLGTLCVTLCVSLLLSESETGRLELIVADVGQGQSIVARMDGLTAVIDCGGTARGGEAQRAKDCLNRLNRSRIDCLILTHLHRDHAEEAPLLLQLVQVDRLLLPAQAEDPDGLLEPILRAAEAAGTEVLEIDRSLTIGAGDQSLSVFPPMGTRGNEQCLSVLLTQGDFDALITGDMDSVAELQLTETFTLPDVEVLVVGHHGSADSTGEAFLDRICPETAVISVGEGNVYGHPAPETLRRLMERGITIYRTDLQGDVRITMD